MRPLINTSSGESRSAESLLTDAAPPCSRRPAPRRKPALPISLPTCCASARGRTSVVRSDRRGCRRPCAARTCATRAPVRRPGRAAAAVPTIAGTLAFCAAVPTESPTFDDCSNRLRFPRPRWCRQRRCSTASTAYAAGAARYAKPPRRGRCRARRGLGPALRGGSPTPCCVLPADDPESCGSSCASSAALRVVACAILHPLHSMSQSLPWVRREIPRPHSFESSRS